MRTHAIYPYLRAAAWSAMMWAGVFTSVMAVEYLHIPASIPEPFHEKYDAHLALVWAHAVSGILALTIGPWQFVESLRRRRSLHRWAGRLYLAAVLAAAVTGFRMGMMAFGGLGPQVAFCLLALAWLATGAMALRTVLRRDFAAHRRWMVRNYTLTLTAVWIRVFLNTCAELGYAIEEVYAVSSWLWVAELLIVEACLCYRPANSSNTSSNPSE